MREGRRNYPLQNLLLRKVYRKGCLLYHLFELLLMLKLSECTVFSYFPKKVLPLQEIGEDRR